MKKLFALAGAFALAITLSACGGSGSSGEKKAAPESKAPETKVGLISTTENVLLPEQEEQEVKVDDADALEKKWKEKGKAFAEKKGVTSERIDATFANFSKDKIKNYSLYLNHNGDWKAGSKFKIGFYCQTVKPTTMEVWIAPDSDESSFDRKGQLTKVACGTDKPAEATREYTLPTDTNNLLIVRNQVPVEGFMVTNDELQK
ncbi:hypothetical protein [Varibaculum cambriense]|uniref:hypothetical protein n=1 Tax=Varibaculum cambriense TaxID=184870 RepID=UPI0029159D6B|nr:hypothetical protein [Varibaculum cambriense]MDU5542515.1 hypothetical protein [Varibaculum cambriense]